MPKPDFFIVGAPKCGTTALYSYLSDHPQIFMSTPKEPHFFADDFPNAPVKTYIRTLDDYLALFDAAAQPHILASGEASATYLVSQSAIPNVYRFNPQARLIAMLRNPVDMVYSLHSQLFYNGEEDEPDFATAWKLQAARQRDPQFLASKRYPRLLQYQAVGMLGQQVQRLLAVVPREQVRLILFDDFRAAPQQVYAETLAFLGVPNDNRTDFQPVNVNRQYRGALTRRLLSPRMAWWGRLKKKYHFQGWGIRHWLRDRSSNAVKRPPLEPQFRAELQAVFREDILLLAQLVGRDLSHWLEA